jgi:hypothetical protein
MLLWYQAFETASLRLGASRFSQYPKSFRLTGIGIVCFAVRMIGDELRSQCAPRSSVYLYIGYGSGVCMFYKPVALL